MSIAVNSLTPFGFKIFFVELSRNFAFGFARIVIVISTNYRCLNLQRFTHVVFKMAINYINK